MAERTLVQQLLDTIFENSDLKSYSIHDKSGLTTFTLRFRSSDHNSSGETGTFIRKSSYHSNRDKARSEAHKSSYPKRNRKQTQFYESQTEQARCEEPNLYSVPDLSPCYVAASSDLSPLAPPFCMNATPPIPGYCLQRETSKPVAHDPTSSSSDCKATLLQNDSDHGSHQTEEDLSQSICSEIDSVTEAAVLATETVNQADVECSASVTNGVRDDGVCDGDDSVSDVGLSSYDDGASDNTLPDPDNKQDCSDALSVETEKCDYHCDSCLTIFKSKHEIYICARGCEVLYCLKCASEHVHPAKLKFPPKGGATYLQRLLKLKYRR